MKLFYGFARLVRWPNLLFIALTQGLFFFCIVQPGFHQAGKTPNLEPPYIWWMILSSVLIAAAGYVINDYFDLNIDRINKPDKLVVERVIRRRWTIIWHMAFSITGVLIGIYIDWKTGVRFLGIANLACVVLLFVYSISLKKKLLSGNILISLLTGWTIFVITWCELNQLSVVQPGFDAERIIKWAFVYGGFAFIISLIREVIKDMEDVEGDRRYGCRTMPIVWGLNVSKTFTAVWLVVLIAAIIVLLVYILRFMYTGHAGSWWWLSILYCLGLILLPLAVIFKRLFPAQSPGDFHKLSGMVKLVMLTGILSIIFLKFYN
ncbi:MAG TPA: geranylgeranylglycerol-phosphate geranylgeranyltransferase [Chitinophagaceae bacterium]